ncbi:hypothetical protein GQ457_07G024510 [Hibiscus cannabinus]
MAAKKIPELRRCIEDTLPQQPDMEQLALNEDGNINNLGNNFYLFVFPSITDKLRVLYQKPWSVQNKLIVLKEWPIGGTLEEIDFSIEDFWIQVHNILMSLISKNNATMIGGLFPVYHYSNVSEESVVQWDGNLNIRAAIRVDDPLKVGFALKRVDRADVNVQFKYKRMPEFCYSCGRIGHALKECWFDNSLFKRAGKYGPWLRAGSKEKKRQE